MSQKIETSNFLNDLDRVVKVRTELANSLSQITTILECAEAEGVTKSGRLELDREIDDLNKISHSLRNGVFRLLVLGDMKRGKSTFLNALIGENLLPSDVNPCTAILTVLRYGPEKKVTIYFNDGTQPETIDFKSFKRSYTIDPTEAKQLETEKKQAFPNVDYAIVEYPLPLLEKGIEIVDSPGLNDTEARNELSLSYIQNCHAILFVLSASQPCTLGERRYLENYIKDRGLSVFFLINAWDRVKESLIDPDDAEEVEEAESKLRRVFKTNLAEYCQLEGYDLYEERAFELSSLMALRRRIKDANASLEGTGFPEFMAALNAFLIEERAIAELRQARTLARQTYTRVRETVERRIPLLEEDVKELKERINSVEPEFKELNEIRDRFTAEIQEMRDNKARAIADSFRNYVLNLGNTFETDFLRYQPSLNFLDFFSKNKREAFELQLRKAFEQYVNDKLAAWGISAEKEMDVAFAQLSQSATRYGASYTKVTDRITEKLTGKTVPPLSGDTPEENSPNWAKWAAGIFSLARGNIAGVAMAGAGFDWKNIMLNFIATLGVGSIIATFSGIAIAPLLPLVGLGIGMLQADQARKELVKAAKKELVKYLPQVAQEQWQPVCDAIKECFDAYEREVTERMNDDIGARQSELENLVKQKESYEVDRGAEIDRLRKVETEVNAEARNVDAAYQAFLSAVG